MSYYGFTLQELRELMELRGEEAKAKERFVDIWIPNSKILEPKLDMGIVWNSRGKCSETWIFIWNWFQIDIIARTLVIG